MEGKTEPSKAEQALIEKIAQEGVNLRHYPNLWRLLNRRRKDNWRNWAKTTILPLIMDAFPELARGKGWKSPEECKACEAVFRGAQEASIETIHGLYEVVRERAE